MTLVMANRYAKTRKFMPGGLAASVGMVGFAYNVKKAIDWME